MINRLKTKQHILLDIGLLICLAIVIIILGQSFMNIVRPFIYGLVFAYILNPIVNLIEKRKIKRTFSVLIVFLAICIIVISAFAMIIPRFAKDISMFVSEEIPEILSFANKIIDDFRARELWVLPQIAYDYINIDSESLSSSSSMILAALA